MYFDTDHHFGVSTREVVLGSKQNAALTVQVDTDLSDYTFQWSDEQGNVSGTAAQSLTGSDFKVEKITGGISWSLHCKVITATVMNEKHIL